MSEIPDWAKIEPDKLIVKARLEAKCLRANSMGRSEELSMAALIDQLVDRVELLQDANAALRQQHNQAVALLVAVYQEISRRFRKAKDMSNELRRVMQPIQHFLDERKEADDDKK